MLSMFAILYIYARFALRFRDLGFLYLSLSKIGVLSSGASYIHRVYVGAYLVITVHVPAPQKCCCVL